MALTAIGTSPPATQIGNGTYGEGGVDLDGGKLILDKAGTSWIDSSTDNDLKININSALDFEITANTFTASAGSSIATDTIVGTSGATVTVGGVALSGGTVSPTGGALVAAGTAPTVFHSGGVTAVAVGTGTDATAVNTETYIVEVFVPVKTTITGVAPLLLATSTGNIQISLADSTGAPIAAAKTASTAAVAAAAFQKIPFATPYVALGPQKFFILMQNSGSNHYRAHAIGNFGASKKTGETYGTFTSVTPPTTFTADIAPICDLY
jgi:hypothetical protein